MSEKTQADRDRADIGGSRITNLKIIGMKKIFTLMTLMMLAAISVKAQNKMIIAY